MWYLSGVAPALLVYVQFSPQHMSIGALLAALFYVGCGALPPGSFQYFSSYRLLCGYTYYPGRYYNRFGILDRQRIAREL